MDDSIRRSVERQFPELIVGYHLARFGVDVEVLLPDCEPDPDLPILTGLPLPAPMGGQEKGMFGFLEEGATVVISFAYGLPHKPFIT